jgi:cytochrome c-type biogenesis protein CcmH
VPKNLLKILLIAALILMPLAPFSQYAKVWATSEVVEFSNPLLRDRYYQLVQELRCPKCQNQNLADSNAPISQDMKAQIHTMLEAQNTDAQIKQHLVSRYSEFVLYRPEVNANTWFLWLSPIGILFLGGLIVWRYAFSKSRIKQQTTNTTELNDSQQQQLSKLLDEEHKP